MSVSRHWSIISLTALLGVLVASSASAEPKMGFVDTQRVLASSKEAKEAEAKLNALLSAKRDLFKPQEEKFNQKRQELQSQASALTPEAIEEKQIELAQLKSQIERDLQAAEEEVQIERRKALAPLIRRVQDVINEVGKAEGFSFIMDRNVGGLVYFSESLDITDKVIEKMNKS